MFNTKMEQSVSDGFQENLNSQMICVVLVRRVASELLFYSQRYLKIRYLGQKNVQREAKSFIELEARDF